jgi:undecaprenyl diphosphate synthase
VQSIAQRVRRGELDPQRIGESTIAGALSTAGLPDPDLLVRTAGERRLSNFLLWQLSYAEIHVTEVLWPEFRAAELQAAFADFAARHRTYGGLARGV